VLSCCLSGVVPSVPKFFHLSPFPAKTSTLFLRAASFASTLRLDCGVGRRYRDANAKKN
jgi:hypothetical protein